MSRIRAIHPRAPLDEDVASLPMDARVLWAYLPCYADREGRLEDRPLFLKGQVFPSDNVDVSAMLDLFAARGFVIRYTATDGRKLIQVAHFHRYQRPDHHERASTLPAPANWEPAARYGTEEENAQATPRQRPGNKAGDHASSPQCPGNAAPGIRDPGSGTPEQGGARVATGRPIRPCTAHNLEHCMRVAIQREQPQAGMWIPGRFSSKEADKLLRDLGDIEAALPELERKIDLFAKDPDMQPWTVAKFADKYNAIGLPKLEFGRAPKPEAPRRSTPVREW